jgi:hypothetical protein
MMQLLYEHVHQVLLMSVCPEPPRQTSCSVIHRKTNRTQESCMLVDLVRHSERIQIKISKEKSFLGKNLGETRNKLT